MYEEILNMLKLIEWFGRMLMLRCTIDLVNIQSEACRSETDEKNEKVLCTHC